MANKKEHYVLAVRDLDKALADIASGKVKMPVDNSKYAEIFSNIVRRCSDLEELNKFIRQNKMKKNECIHWWEGILDDGYELITVQYNAPDENFVELAGSENLIKYVTSVKG
ncbi:MAG: hypothetical protein PHV04_10615 [Clostridia bacterium]|nr:hypothetical protein [Clostridia bacterium]